MNHTQASVGLYDKHFQSSINNIWFTDGLLKILLKDVLTFADLNSEYINRCGI